MTEPVLTQKFSVHTHAYEAWQLLGIQKTEPTFFIKKTNCNIIKLLDVMRETAGTNNASKNIEWVTVWQQ